ncbi:uncharacterized protein [Nicotiana tomentosiformis]|uniref:uncharacterized protein n=1 Tax=Nicotiana tomentosiformis TaxID=4098 RepID=UPI00388CCE07
MEIPFQVTLSVPEYVNKYGVAGTPQYVWDQEEVLAGRIINKRAASAMLFCYDLENEGAIVQVKAHVSESGLPQYEFTEFHSGLKLGDVVGIVGLPGNRNRGGVTIYPRSFVVLSHRHHMLPLQRGAPLDTTKAALRVSQDASIVTTADHRAGKIEAEFYDKVVLEGSQNASIITTTDHRAGKFEAEFCDKILQEEIGCVKGLFGTTKALASNLDGKSFTSGGGEDGYVGVHPLDHDYFSCSAA